MAEGKNAFRKGNSFPRVHCADKTYCIPSEMCLEPACKMINRASISHKGLTFESSGRQKAQLARDGEREQPHRIPKPTYWPLVRTQGVHTAPSLRESCQEPEDLREASCHCKTLHLRKISFQVMEIILGDWRNQDDFKKLTRRFFYQAMGLKCRIKFSTVMLFTGKEDRYWKQCFKEDLSLNC